MRLELLLSPFYKFGNDSSGILHGQRACEWHTQDPKPVFSGQNMLNIEHDFLSKKSLPSLTHAVNYILIKRANILMAKYGNSQGIIL